MSATNAVAVKAALLTLIQGLALGDVQIGYGPPANPERDFIYLGKIAGPIRAAAFRAGGRVPRIEDLTLQVHIVATTPGGSGVELLASEERAVELAGAVIDAVAADPLLAGVPGGVPGLAVILVSRMELESGADDDASSAWITLWFDAKSHLT